MRPAPSSSPNFTFASSTHVPATHLQKYVSHDTAPGVSDATGLPSASSNLPTQLPPPLSKLTGGWLAGGVSTLPLRGLPKTIQLSWTTFLVLLHASRGGSPHTGATLSLGRSSDVVHVANGQGQSPVATSAWMERALASSMQSTHSPSASRYWP